MTNPEYRDRGRDDEHASPEHEHEHGGLGRAGPSDRDDDVVIHSREDATSHPDDVLVASAHPAGEPYRTGDPGQSSPDAADPSAHREGADDRDADTRPEAGDMHWDESPRAPHPDTDPQREAGVYGGPAPAPYLDETDVRPHSPMSGAADRSDESDESGESGESGVSDRSGGADDAGRSDVGPSGTGTAEPPGATPYPPVMSTGNTTGDTGTPAGEAAAAAGAGGAASSLAETREEAVSVRDYQPRWQEIQVGFVDDPRKAVEQADALVEEVVQDLVSAVEEMRDTLRERWREGSPDTESLRETIQHYRWLLRELTT
ncbi:hypothetical protein [Bailinhaonella thermotolerans]|uniref:Uncharacterized protein n=1 Tax=Bailinhaonella thermotolerans TaxID=1070861 RepID=A0A3A4BFR6_9ACTN|nr:hypothetical protein [Bailinhaonella thermotolerans]RJL33332.1 hypothetical protein D5H75_11050 [Bailinhaonella thermotolerans]